jgi:hypothetical protein
VEREIAAIKFGKTTTMHFSDSEFVDLVMSDPECVERICDVSLKALVIVPVRSDRYDLNVLQNQQTLESIELVYGDSEQIPSSHLRVLKTLPRLSDLILHSRELSDADLETLKAMSNLRRISAPLNSEQKKQLRQALPHVRIL